MTTEKLKPCPFCGEREITVEITPGADTGYAEFSISCGCLSCLEVYGSEIDGDTEETVAAQWNTRPLESAMEERVKELEGELAQARAAVKALSNMFDLGALGDCERCPFKNPCCQALESDKACALAVEKWAYAPQEVEE